MNLTTWMLAAAVLGVDVGWQPLPGGGMEYIIQIEPELLDALRRGEVVVSQVPPQVKDVRQYRIVVGRGRLPRITPAATQPEKQITSPLSTNLPKRSNPATSSSPSGTAPGQGPGPASSFASQPLGAGASEPPRAEPPRQAPAEGNSTLLVKPSSPLPARQSDKEAPGPQKPSPPFPGTAGEGTPAGPFSPSPGSPQPEKSDSPQSPAGASSGAGLPPWPPRFGNAPARLPGSSPAAEDKPAKEPEPAPSPLGKEKPPAASNPYRPPQGFGLPTPADEPDESAPPDENASPSGQLPSAAEDRQAQLPPRLPAADQQPNAEEPPHRLTSFRGLEDSKPLPKKNKSQQKDSEEPEDPEQSPSDAKDQQPVQTTGGWGWFTLVVLGLFASLSGNVYLGGTLYQQRQHFRQLLAQLRGQEPEEPAEEEALEE